MAFSPYYSPALLSSLQCQYCGKETVSHSLKVTDVLNGPAGTDGPACSLKQPQRTADSLCTEFLPMSTTALPEHIHSDQREQKNQLSLPSPDSSTETS